VGHTERYFQANRANWDDRAPIDFQSDGYGVPEFVSDPAALTPTVGFDRTELADVRGRSLLHLQCHIGTDTISWARLGATVTGVDFSPRSIDFARRISSMAGAPARFVVSDVYELPGHLDEVFDVVYTGCGALCWLPDVTAWAEIVAGFLRQGGTFYMRDGHPVLWAAESELDNGRVVLVHPYSTRAPVKFDRGGRYSRPHPRLTAQVTYEWNHGIGEVVTALVEAGLAIEYVHEHEFCDWPAIRGMVEGGDRMWRLPGFDRTPLPLTYSIRARRP
jgi:SAM-dependent methyltransferase